MAIGKKTGGKDFTSTYQPEGRGRKKLTEYEKEVRERLRTGLAEVCELLLTDVHLVVEKMKRGNPTVLETFIGFAIEKKDHKYLEMLLTRALGKPKEHIEIKSTVEQKSDVDLKVLSTEQLEAIQGIIDG